MNVLPLEAPRDLADRPVFLVAGHANGRGKDGNTGVHGQIEADVALDTVQRLAGHLDALDRFELGLGREAGERPSYGTRIARAEAADAAALVEIHTDSRGALEPWAVLPDGEWVFENEGEPGFSVLYNATGPLGPDRQRLAVHIAESLASAGFPAYSGIDYGTRYDPEGTPGVFIDRRGLMMLRRPSVPSVIVETHNAKDFDESLRWRESDTHAAFASAMANGLTRFLGR